MPVENQQSVEAAEALYGKYVKPVEADHAGEYVAVSPDGELVFAPTLVDAVERAETTLGSGNIIFKVGQIVVGRWLQLTTE